MLLQKCKVSVRDKFDLMHCNEVTLSELPEGADYGKVDNENPDLFTVSEVSGRKVTVTAGEIPEDTEPVNAAVTYA